MCSVLEVSPLEGDRIWLYNLSTAQPQATAFTAQPFPKAWPRAPSLSTEEQIRLPLLWGNAQFRQIRCLGDLLRWRKGEGSRLASILSPRSPLLWHLGARILPGGHSFPLVLHWAPTFSIGQIFPDGFLTSEMEVSNGNPCGPLLRTVLVGASLIIQLPNPIYLS